MAEPGTIGSMGEDVSYGPALFLGGLVALVAGILLVWVPLVLAGLVAGAAGAIMTQKAQEAKPNESIVCKFCQTKGTVHTGARVRKQGISGGKATGALFTGGLSMLVTGLSRKQQVTHLWCDECGMAWDE